MKPINCPIYRGDMSKSIESIFLSSYIENFFW